MSILRELPREHAITGLKLKRRLGDKLQIIHGDDTLTVQLIRFESGWQVVLAFQDDSGNFKIIRSELWEQAR